jgi:hypothetical protein
MCCVGEIVRNLHMKPEAMNSREDLCLVMCTSIGAFQEISSIFWRKNSLVPVGTNRDYRAPFSLDS